MMLKAEMVIQQDNTISVVIPTLGGESLANTIEQVNCGTLVPPEILVCIPEEDAYKVENFLYPNVRIIKTKCRGQVAQRAIGLQTASSTMVLQLDDDIFLPEETLELLFLALRDAGPGNVVAPVYYLKSINRPSHEFCKGLGGFLDNLVTSTVCGAKWGPGRMGTVTSIGTSYGVDDRYCSSKAPFATEWLPGGCLLSFKEDLVTDTFFPFTGKAFCEDLIHSYLRVKKGIRHYVIPSAKCLIEFAFPESTNTSVLAQRKAQRYYVSLIDGSFVRLYFYEKLVSLKRVFRSLLG
jgi:glycosyltransferase involved in cell wall biosynthesis